MQFEKWLKSTSFKTEQRPNIFLIMIDTLRSDHVDTTLTPNIIKFSKEALSTELTVAPATATHHANFSLFYSQPAFVRERTMKVKWSMGSTGLNIMKEMGYDIHLIGRSGLYYCGSSNPTGSSLFPANDRNHQHLQLIYGGDTEQLLTKCLDFDYSTKNLGNPQVDTLTVKHFKKILSEIPKSSGQFFHIVLDGPHSRYEWLDDEIDYIDKPSTQTLPVKHYHPSQFLRLQNSYRNAVRTTDRRFADLIKELKKQNLYENSLIILYADHGERLGDSLLPGHIRGRNGHGFAAHKSLNNIITFYRFPSNNQRSFETKELSSLDDIFPTIVDFLKGPNTDKIFHGRSLFKANKKLCKILVRPAMEKEPWEIVFHSPTKKLWTSILRKNSNQGSLVFHRLTNLEDIDLEEWLGFSSLRRLDLKNYLVENFGACYSAFQN